MVLRQALKKLTDDDTIIINKADKDTNVVIQNKDTYTHAGLNHLKGTTTDTELEIDPTTTLTKNIDKALKETHRTIQITKNNMNS